MEVWCSGGVVEVWWRCGVVDEKESKNGVGDLRVKEGNGSEMTSGMTKEDGSEGRWSRMW